MAQIKKISNPKHKKTTIITFIMKASLQNNNNTTTKKKKKNLSFEEPSLYLWLSVAYKGKGTMTMNSDTKLGVQCYHITRNSILIRNQQLYIDILMSHSPRINFICHIICAAKISKPRIICLLLSSCFEHCH